MANTFKSSSHDLRSEDWKAVRPFIPAWTDRDMLRAENLVVRSYTGTNEQRSIARQELVKDFGMPLTAGISEGVGIIFTDIGQFAWEGFFQTIADRRADPERAKAIPFVRDAAVCMLRRSSGFISNEMPRENLSGASKLRGSALDAVAVRAKFINSQKNNGPRSVLYLAMNDLVNLTAKKVSDSVCRPDFAEDLAQFGWEKLFEDILDCWDPVRSQFMTYSGRALANEMKRKLDDFQVVHTSRGVRDRRAKAGMDTFTKLDFGVSIIDNPDENEEGHCIDGSKIIDESQETEWTAISNASHEEAEEFRRQITEGYFNKSNVSATLRRILLAGGVINTELDERTLRNVASLENLTTRAVQISVQKIREIIVNDIKPAPDRFIPMNQYQADALTAFIILRHYNELVSA